MHLRTVSGRGGGPEKTLLSTPQYLPGYDVRLVCIRPEDDPDYNMPERARKLGVQLVDIAERHGFDVRTLIRLGREVRAFRPHILHPHDYKTNALSLLIGRCFGIPVVTTAHGNVSRGGRLEFYYRLDGWCYRRMRHVFAVSEDIVSYARGLRVPQDRLSLVHNAIDTQLHKRQDTVDETKRRLGFRTDTFLVGSIARLASEKRFDVLIDAVSRLASEGIEIELLIAGDGTERERLERHIGEQPDSRRFQLLGYRSDTTDLLQALDVFALTSDREGLPNSLLEAMAMEVPIVATRVGGISSLVSDGHSGLLVDPASAADVADCLRRLFASVALRRRLAEQARRTVESRFDFASRMRRIRSVYDAVVAGDTK